MDRQVFELLTVSLGRGIAGLPQCQELKIQLGEKQETYGTRGEKLAWVIVIS